ncbi:MAG: hypothetical protein V3U71_08250 [Cocleimonas sp.]
MNLRKTLGVLILSALPLSSLVAKDLPFTLTISGKNFDLKKELVISEPTEDKTKINFDFKDTSGAAYNFDLKYKKLPANRSYPSNLDITVKDSTGNKLGYIFWANNGTEALKRLGTIGMIVDVNGEPMDVKFNFDADDKGNLFVKDLEGERYVSDTLIPKKGFQMIRPMLVPLVSEGIRQQAYDLDAHPFKIDYTLKDIDNGLVQFQYNLYKKDGDKSQLLERIYFNADSVETLRDGMFAGKYFDKEYGTFKLVFYPTMGQTAPPK